VLAYAGGYGSVQPTGGVLTRINNNIYLGANNFPAIIVPSEYIKDKIAADPMWKNYGKVTSASGFTSDYGFLDEEGNIIKSNIVGDYKILVNPQGLACWTVGSAESVLEAVWTARQLKDAYSEEEFYNIIKDFYKKFYRHTLTEDELEMIMLGREDSAPETVPAGV